MSLAAATPPAAHNTTKANSRQRAVWGPYTRNTPPAGAAAGAAAVAPTRSNPSRILANARQSLYTPAVGMRQVCHFNKLCILLNA